MNVRDAIIGGLILVIAFLIVVRQPEDEVPPMPEGCLFPPEAMEEGLRWRCVVGNAARGCVLGSLDACLMERHMYIFQEDERTRFAVEHSVWLSKKGDL